VEKTAERHSVAEVVIPPGLATLRHYHPVAEETYYILLGRGRIIIDGEEAEAVPGEAIYIAPGEHHKLENLEDADLRLLCVCAPAWEPTNTVWLEEWRYGRALPETEKE
jgi:mannose-6-phosphate isomerase-like protein (cupin superfamily)